MRDLGTRLYDALKEEAGLTVERLAEMLEEDNTRVGSRLNFLRSASGCVKRDVIEGKKVWSVVPDVVPPWGHSRKRLSDEEREIDRGWKPDVSSLPALAGPVAPNDKLLVEHPDRWRDSVLCSVIRDPDEKGIALCWDLKLGQKCYVDTVGFAARGMKIARVEDEKVLMRLENS